MANSYRPVKALSLCTYGTSVTTLSFDPVSDLLWVGTSSGHVFSTCSTRDIREVSFPVGGHNGVKKILADEKHVRAISIDGNGLGTWLKGGMNKWFYKSPTASISTFCTLTNSTKLAASTSELELLYLNSLTGAVLRRSSVPSLITHLANSHSSQVSGSMDGYIRSHDPRLTNTWVPGTAVKAHHGGVRGLQTVGNFIFTIGTGESITRTYLDPLVKVFDIRTMKPLSPITFSPGPAFIHVLPKRQSTIAVVSNQGLVNIVDVTNPASTEFYQLNPTSEITSFSISPTNTYMAFGDAEGLVHLWSQVEDGASVPYNGFEGRPIEFANAPAEIPQIEWTDNTPLNTIGLPHYDSPLLSSWTADLTSGARRYGFPGPQTIPPLVLNTMRIKDEVAYANLPKELKGTRNVATVVAGKQQPRFRSDRARNSRTNDDYELQHANGDIPRVYRQVEIEYSKFGVEDFDFGFYNKTEFSGLETHILNSYTNAVVQVMHYMMPIRRLAKSHITTACMREHCLLCELGFVSRMLEDAHGTNCQASNFCKTVGVLAQVSNAIELMDFGVEAVQADQARRIQTFHRFLLEHLQAEGNAPPYNPILTKEPRNAGQSTSPLTQLLGISGKTTTTCPHCRAVRDKDNHTTIVDLIYPRKAPGETGTIDFTTLLHHSLLREVTHKAPCPVCRQMGVFTSWRSIAPEDLPPILSLNANVFDDDAASTWLDSSSGRFIKTEIHLAGTEQGRSHYQSVKYILRSMVVQVVVPGKSSHLVAIIKVPEAEGNANLKSPWFVFNDFVVENVTEQEALSFPDKWKVPAIIHYERADNKDTLMYDGLPGAMDERILSQDTSIARNRDLKLVKHLALSADELPKPGTLIAIDAEFVLMQQEETEFRSDGTKKILRPARLSLARVSVLRGEGPKKGLPFIDDYIHTSELIVDYLTEYSGIRFGDLDPQISRHTLTPLKVVYKKLRLLVDRGCVFVGHGLSKDFRIINLFVPPNQVIDTVDLFFIKERQRRLSLRFLCWFLLNEQIQMETHDSIEDAHSALSLYEVYRDWDAQDIVEEKLDELYREGRLFNFKPPSAGEEMTSFSPPTT